MAVVMPMSWEIGVSVALHAMLALTLTFAKCEGSTRPPLAVQEVMLMSTGPARQTTKMPQKAERAPDPVKGAASPTAEPPPVRQSDLAIKTPDAPVHKGENTNNLARERLIAEMKRQEALANLAAPVGTTNRADTSPDSTLDPSEATGGVGGAIDLALARWNAEAERAVKANWHPLASLCASKPSMKAVISVSIDAQGTLLGEPKVKTSTGDGSLDEAARRAVELTRKLPPTPNGKAFNVSLEFPCKEVL